MEQTAAESPSALERLSLVRRLLVIALCACSRVAATSAPSAPDATAPPRVAIVDTASPDAAPPDAAVTATTPAGVPNIPKLTIAEGTQPYDWKLVADGIPAISADGKRAVVIVNLPDGGRGYPKNEVVFIAIDTDKIEKRMKLFVAEDFDAEPSVIARRTAGRLASAQAELAKTSWVTLASTRSVWNPSLAKYEWGPVAGVDVSLDSGHLRAKTATSTLLDRNVASWNVAPYKVLDFSPCEFAPSIELIAIDTSRHALVVIVSQIPSGDHCEQPTVAHAFRLL